MNQNDKKAKNKAKRAKSNLKNDIRDKNSNKREQRALEKERKISEKNSLKTTEFNTQSVKTNQEKIDKLREQKKRYLAEDNKVKAAKIESKIEREINKDEIKRINKLNKSSKGRRVPNDIDKSAIIEVRDLSKIYTTKSIIFKALGGVNLKIYKGEFVVILGPSGSGKSTLLNMISGLDRSTDGEVIVDGENISTYSERELTNLRRQKIGFVFQSYNLLSTLNVSDNVEIGRTLQEDKSKRMDTNKVLTDLGLGDHKHKRTYELSGGQQQRVSIARALAKSPKILIGDEPTGALDKNSRTDVFKFFKEINKKIGTTIIIVTHNETIARLADKVIRIDDGKINSIDINKKPESADILLKSFQDKKGKQNEKVSK